MSAPFLLSLGVRLLRLLFYLLLLSGGLSADRDGEFNRSSSSSCVRNHGFPDLISDLPPPKRVRLTGFEVSESSTAAAARLSVVLEMSERMEVIDQLEEPPIDPVADLVSHFRQECIDNEIRYRDTQTQILALEEKIASLRQMVQQNHGGIGHVMDSMYTLRSARAFGRIFALERRVGCDPQDAPSDKGSSLRLLSVVITQEETKPDRTTASDTRNCILGLESPYLSSLLCLAFSLGVDTPWRHRSLIPGIVMLHSTEGAVGLTRWFEKLESQFGVSNVAEGDRVKFAASTLSNSALTWWNIYTKFVGIDVVHATSWRNFKQMLIKKYCPRNELALLCPEMVPIETRAIERYIRGLPLNIKGNVTSSRPVDLHETIEMAQSLMDQVILEMGEESPSKGKNGAGKSKTAKSAPAVSKSKKDSKKSSTPKEEPLTTTEDEPTTEELAQLERAKAESLELYNIQQAAKDLL
ncbi:hypothetical protein Tco_0760995 [Tanacetum coccineum]